VWLKIYSSKGDWIFELLFDEGKKVVEFMIQTPKVPKVGTN
jgi:hypothetical protein